MDESIVTLLVPVFKAKEYFEETLKTILWQKQKNFKIVICDDSSNDGTYEFIKDKVKDDSRFKVIRTETNSGLGKVRDILIQNCETKYFLFLDDDDYLGKNAIAKMSKKALETDADTVTSKVLYHFKTKRGNYSILPPLYKYSNIKTTSQFLINNIVYFWGNFIKKSFFDSLNIKIESRLFEDIAPVTKLFINAKSFAHVNVLGVRYYRRSNSLSAFSGDNFRNKMNFLFAAYKKALEYIEADVKEPKEKIQLIDAKFYNYLALMVLFYRKVNHSTKEQIVKFIKENIIPLAKLYNWKPKPSIQTWKIFVNNNKHIMNALKGD
ncbi:glycosyltransferase family 2 protein [Mycoplasma zalophidermidis]|uniref:glycosyltransferase family 2 protein n=1 Tax=Mycoplasma zalophidermidis TaxID=398174 RepID=UPI00215C7C3A|nr:glycosyltransferase family 2 protein [Mycoplasma zalophidermidis]MCR8966430.1 glycosyltransferase [Mycoplasma zalophidermidis]